MSADELAGIKVCKCVVYREYLGVNRSIVMEMLAELWKFSFLAKVSLSSRAITRVLISSAVK